MSPSRGLLQPFRPAISALSGTRPLLQRPQASLRISQKRFFGESVVESVYLGLSSFHNVTGLPWYAVLPLTALTVRMAIVLPLQIVAAHNQRKCIELRPRVHEARPRLEREVIAKHNHEGPVKCTRYLSRALVKEQKKVEREAGVSHWRSWLPLAQLPVWFVIIEAIRRMCGERVGLLGLLMGWGKTAKESNNAAGSTTPGPDGSELVDHTAARTSDADLSVLWDNMLEPSLGLEGCLWFPNLLVPDPQLILPFTLSGVMFSSLWLEERKADLKGLERPRWSRILTNSLKLVALVVGPATLNMPAAIHVYWISSGLIALPQKSLVDYLAPVPVPKPYVTEKAFVARSDTVNGAPIQQQKKHYVPLRSPRRR